MKDEGGGGEKRRSKVEEIAMIFEGEIKKSLSASVMGGGGEGGRIITSNKVGVKEIIKPENGHPQLVPLRLFRAQSYCFLQPIRTDQVEARPIRVRQDQETFEMAIMLLSIWIQNGESVRLVSTNQ